MEEISNDIFCPNCQYNLRGLNPSGLCPECGEPVQNALIEVSVWNTDVQWVRAQRNGVVFALAAFAADGVAFLLQTVFALYLPIQLVSGVLTIVSALCLTVLNRDPRLKTPAPTARLILRVTAMLETVHLGHFLLGFASMYLNFGLSFWFISMVSSLIGFEARGCYLILLVRYFRKPDFQKSIRQRLLLVMVGLPLSLVLFFFALVTGGGFMPFSGGRSGPGGLILLIAAGGAFVVSCLWYMAVLIRLARGLNQVLNGVPRV